MLASLRAVIAAALVTLPSFAVAQTTIYVDINGTPPGSVVGLPVADFEGDPREVGACVDIGADEACLVGSDEGFDLESLVMPRSCQKNVVVGDSVTLTIRRFTTTSRRSTRPAIARRVRFHRCSRA